MKTWYSQQDFYTEERYNAIVSWTEQEVIDIYEGMQSTPSLKIA